MSTLPTAIEKAISRPKQPEEINIQQAAELLAVSETFFIKLLEQGEIPYQGIGKQRRVRYQDLAAYLASYQRQAIVALDELTTEMHALNLYA